MERSELYDFIQNLNLMSSDCLLKIILVTGEAHYGIWIKTLHPLGPSVDGVFKGFPGAELFFLTNKETYRAFQADEIENLLMVDPDYLKYI